MKSNTILLIAVLVIGALVGYVFGSQNDTPEACHHDDHAEHMDEASHMMHDDMGAMNDMDHSTMMVGSEREFITHMIPHHQEAVDTAQEVLERGGTTPEIRTLAESIISTQVAEIDMMKEWHLNWYREAYVDTGSYTPMMRELENLTGAELDQVFLEDMIGHHMGAIMMSRSVRPYIEHSEVTELADAIELTQSAEIAAMRGMLKTL